MVTGPLFNTWCTREFNSDKYTIDSTPLNKSSQATINNFDNTGKVSCELLNTGYPKSYPLLGKPQIIAWICYRLIEKMDDDNYFELSNFSVINSMNLNLIPGLRTKIYNLCISSVKQDYKFGDRKKINFLIDDVIKELGILADLQGENHIDEQKVEDLKNEIVMHFEGILRTLVSVISKLAIVQTPTKG